MSEEMESLLSSYLENTSYWHGRCILAEMNLRERSDLTDEAIKLLEQGKTAAAIKVLRAEKRWRYTHPDCLKEAV